MNSYAAEKLFPDIHQLVHDSLNEDYTLGDDIAALPGKNRKWRFE